LKSAAFNKPPAEVQQEAASRIDNIASRIRKPGNTQGVPTPSQQGLSVSDDVGYRHQPVRDLVTDAPEWELNAQRADPVAARDVIREALARERSATPAGLQVMMNMAATTAVVAAGAETTSARATIVPTPSVGKPYARPAVGKSGQLPIDPPPIESVGASDFWASQER
jgi:hypothetical protein